eukprot:g26701.t1
MNGEADSKGLNGVLLLLFSLFLSFICILAFGVNTRPHTGSSIHLPSGILVPDASEWLTAVWMHDIWPLDDLDSGGRTTAGIASAYFM